MSMYIRRLIRALKPIDPRIGVEVGVWKGALSMALHRAFPDLHLLMVDQYDAVAGEGTFVKREWDQGAYNDAMLLALSRTDPNRRTLIVDRSTNAAQLVSIPLDFAFIDADHHYESVKQDIGIWYPLVRSGGIVSGHDYNSNSDRMCDNYGVRRAVDEFTQNNRYAVNVMAGNVWWFAKR